MKNVFLAPVLWLALTVPAVADKLSVSEISKYLNSFNTAQAKFTQVTDDGGFSTGALSLRRPGRARFDYDDGKGLVIAGGGMVAIFDPVSNTPPQQYPLKRTPLTHILARNVNLGASGMLLGHDYDGTSTSVLIQDPQHPEYGNIRLVFTDAPVRLRQWVLTNESGGETTVILNDMNTNVSLGARMFNIPQEVEARGLK